MEKYSNQEYWNKLLLTELPMPKEDIKEWLKAYAAPYKELMAYYRCAMMEVETKFRVLNEELSLRQDLSRGLSAKVTDSSTKHIRVSGIINLASTHSVNQNHQ